MSDTSEDAAEFRCLVPFPDGSPSFVDGFEAGMIWQRMVRAETPIDPRIAVHSRNREVLSRMAAAQGYDMDVEDDDGIWMVVTFAKRRQRFSVV